MVRELRVQFEIGHQPLGAVSVSTLRTAAAAIGRPSRGPTVRVEARGRQPVRGREPGLPVRGLGHGSRRRGGSTSRRRAPGCCAPDDRPAATGEHERSPSSVRCGTRDRPGASGTRGGCRPWAPTGPGRCDAAVAVSSTSARRGDRRPSGQSVRDRCTCVRPCRASRARHRPRRGPRRRPSTTRSARRPSGVRTSVPAGRHWSVSPTTVTLWWPPASSRTISFWAWLVSWYSSTRTCWKRSR